MNYREVISAKLDEIEKKENVKILHAIESGSRAWGFASSDSDYDVRFIYVRKQKEYLKLQDTKDFIDWELNEVLDINGWDLKKVLRLAHKSNSTIFEWANSPIVYRTTNEWQDIYKVIEGYFSKKATMYHYYGTAKSNYNNYLKEDYVKYKKYFYVIRPLLACKWIEINSCPPPVFFDNLKEKMLEDNMRIVIDELQAIKMTMKESEKGKRMEVINDYIVDELERYGELISRMDDDRTIDWENLNRVFCKYIL